MGVSEVQSALAEEGYVAGGRLSMALHLANTLGRPLLLEGPAGVGKTEVAKALATVQGTELIRLQCYEGLDASHAIYEWNYQRQLLSIRAAEAQGVLIRSADEFALRDGRAPHAVRIAVNAHVSLRSFDAAMQRLRYLLDNPPEQISV